MSRKDDFPVKRSCCECAKYYTCSPKQTKKCISGNYSKFTSQLERAKTDRRKA